MSGEALGGWLHRVAYRASVQASIEARRRRRKEAREAADGPPETRLVRKPNWPLRLQEEIHRLPEPAPARAVVLCDLEGLSYEEAAGRLGWTVPRLRHRLAEGRKRLRDRLGRRGEIPPAVGTVVPPSLARAAVASSTGGATPAGWRSWHAPSSRGCS